MEYTAVANLQWFNAEQTALTCDVVFTDLGIDPVGFCATVNDVEAHGREIFERAVAGDFGAIADYVDTSPSAEEQLAVWRTSATCGPLELRRALRQLGLLEAVKTYLATADEEIQEAWEYATVIKRNDPFISAVQLVLKKTDEEVDDLFQLAITLG